MELVISKPQHEILQSDADINLFLGGVGSGKTFLGGIISYTNIQQYPDLFGFIAANTFDQLDKSTLYRIKETWKLMGLTEWSKENPQGVFVSGIKPPSHFVTDTHNFDSYHSIISFITGAAIFTGSLENAKSHEGKQFAWAILDETKDTREHDVKEIILARLRQAGIKINGNDVCPLYILTSPAKVDWINNWFDLDQYMSEINSTIFNEGDYFTNRLIDKFVVISSTHHNQDNLPSNYIQKILNNNTKERGNALIYANPFSATGGEFYSSFSRLEHVEKCSYNPELPLHVSFDQNVVPYTPALIGQITKINDTWHISYIDEICLKNPRNTTEDVANEVLRQYGDCAGIYFYGDASGKARKGLTKDIKHHYQLIERILHKKLVNGSNRVMRSNPPLIKRREFMNKIFENKLPINVTIDPKCVNLLADLTYIKQDLDGTKRKDVVTDPETKERYEKYGHLSDCCFIGSTEIITKRGNIPISQVNENDYVLTRVGYRRVLKVHNNGMKETQTYRVGRNKVTCTPDHRIFANNEFISINNLIGSIIFCIFARKTSWKEKLFSLMGINFQDTQTLQGEVIENILRDGLIKIKCTHIDTYGKNIMVKSLKACTFIIKIAIQQITILTTLNLLNLKSIFLIITKTLLTNIKKSKKTYFLHWLCLKQPNGISPKRVENGTKNTLKIQSTERKERLYAKSAVLNILLTLKWKLNIAQEGVKIDTMLERIENQVSGMKQESVNIAKTNLMCIDGQKMFIAASNVQDIGKRKINNVYDLTVQGKNEYFANGILVHNCDYLQCAAFDMYF